ncbi:hypothetical protein CYLTODRAFT_487603 [Cylindrobasidium torrendii FP15055 ss-10]|uniref:Uncharacterized protein n=1 Tax=Cylindrobasidium torrendii FP15055 ss-10 TaxID=1314674 RepID=A0A0D7BLE1_9AGAR|nr:hypothetical protein CYLTODRAFT_487603 [Cylindrobasidium torrendii FP15055 ss-10]
MAESTVNIVQSYQACPAENCPCPYHRIGIPEPEDFGNAFEALQAFDALRMTNEQPTPGEETSILASIASLSTSLNDVHSIIVELQATRNAITPRIKAYQEVALDIKESIDEHRLLLSALRRLSAELLVEIFSHVVEEELFEPTEQAILPDALRTKHFPSPLPHLALTCQRWNSVVFGTPKLWSRINIDLCVENIPETDEVSQYYSQLSRHFTRTARTETPLTISIGTCNAADDNYDLNPITFLLLSYAFRITHLTLFLPPEALERLNSIGPHFTSLVYATVVNTVWDETDEVFEAFGQSTTLRTFNAINFDKLRDVHIPIGVKHLSLRHHSIPHSDEDYDILRDDSYGLPEHINVLTNLKGLATLCIDIGGNDVRLNGMWLSLPALEQLTVTSLCNKPIYVLLQHITVPSLECLTLSSSLGSADSFAAHYFQAIGDMVQRSACRLTYLELAFRAKPSPVPMLTALYRLSTLKHLTIRHRTKSRIVEIFGDKGLHKEGEMLLPALRTLVLEGTPIITKPLPALADWINVRAHSASLEKVVINSMVPGLSALGSNDAMRMARFRKRLEKLDGLEVDAGFSTVGL